MTLKKMTIQETVGSNFTEHLKEKEDIKKIHRVLNFMTNNILYYKTGHLHIDIYISFYKLIHEDLWSKKPIFYYRKQKFDGMGFLGESPHKFNVQSKTLSMYFQEVLGYPAVRVCDNDIDEFKSIKSPKKRFISALKKIKESATDQKLLNIFNKAKEIYNERYY